jgi:hypothetical protein
MFIRNRLVHGLSETGLFIFSRNRDLFSVQIRSTMMNRLALADKTKLHIVSHGLAGIAKLPLVCRPFEFPWFVDETNHRMVSTTYLPMSKH